MYGLLGFYSLIAFEADTQPNLSMSSVSPDFVAVQVELRQE